MRFSNMWGKIPRGLQRVIVGAGIVGALSVAGKAYISRYGDLWTQSGQMASLIENSPRKEYIVQEGDTLDSLRKRFFPVADSEFQALDDKSIYWNQEGLFQQRFGGYKNLMANNVWLRTIRDKRDFKNFEFGDTILAPYRSEFIN